MKSEQHYTRYEEEVALAELSDFSQTAERLFGLADDPENRGLYHTIDWQDESSLEINDVFIQELTPTGARRHEQKRQIFDEAQFRVVSTSTTTGDKTETFIWCKTDPAPWNIRVEPDADFLEVRFGCLPLTPDNIVRALAPRTKTVDEQSELLEFMREWDLKASTELSSLLSTQVYRGINENLDDPKGTLYDDIYRDKLFAMLRILDRVNPEIAVKLHSQMVSRLLQAINTPGKHQSIAENDSRQQSALDMLEGAFKRGVLSHVGRTLDRVLSDEGVFRSDFMTELLYNELHSRRFSNQNKNMYRINREAYAHDFIVGTIIGRLRKYPDVKSETHERARAFVDRNPRTMQYVVTPLDFGDVYSLAKDLGSKLEFPRPPKIVRKKEKGKIVERLEPAAMADFTLVRAAYDDILSALRADNPDVSDDQAELDAHCVEIVRIATLPYEWNKLIRRVLGKVPGISVDEETGTIFSDEVTSEPTANE